MFDTTNVFDYSIIGSLESWYYYLIYKYLTLT